jgi:hypothetical protein
MTQHEQLTLWATVGSTLVGFLALGASVFALVRESRKQRKESHNQNELTKSEIYQRLEFASIDLFRFEFEHGETCQRLYDNNNPITVEEEKSNPVVFRKLMNHVTSILNLFEMAVEFRKKDILPHEIFATWVAWMFSMGQYKSFINIWNWEEEEGVTVSEHYSPTLHKVIELAIKYNSTTGTDGQTEWNGFVEEVCVMYNGCEYINALKKLKEN